MMFGVESFCESGGVKGGPGIKLLSGISIFLK